MKSAFPVILTARLNLKPRDIAEIGGFSLRFAQALTAGKVAFPQDVITALEQIDEDLDDMQRHILSKYLNDPTYLYIFHTNEELRENFPDWPGRGASGGPFVGPHRIATYYAWVELKEQYEAPQILFHP